MRIALNGNEKWKIEDWLFFLILIFQDVGTMNVLPLNLFQILMIGILIILMMRYFRRKRIVNAFSRYLLCIGYIVIVTFTHRFDIESIKSVGYFAIQYLAILLYFLSLDDYWHFFKIVYRAGFVIAFYGVVQEVGFLLNIPEIYDITRYGFNTNGSYTVSFGFIRAMSLYSEPSHTAYIIASAFLIGLISFSSKREKKSIFGILIICTYAFFTLSLIVWMCFGMALALYIFVIDKSVKNKIRAIVIALSAILMLLIANPDFFAYVLGKFQQFQRLSTDTNNDLSALAVVSNLKVAWAKNLDGFIFGTGFDSHRLYYDQYIDKLYTNLIMRLNYLDGASFYVRVLSEFGIIGLTVFVLAMISKFVKARKRDDIMMMVFLALYLVFMLRNGSYVYVLPGCIFAIVFLLPDKEHRRLCRRGECGNESV